MISFTFLWRLLCLFLACSQANPVPSGGYQVVERLPGVPEGWTEHGAPSSSTLVKFRMAIRHKRMAEFEQRTIDIATPGSHLYGHFMTGEEVNDFLRPSDDAVRTIFSWMKSEHIPEDSTERHGNWITFTVPISQAEKLLDTQFHYFRNEVNQKADIRTLSYSVPKDVYAHVQMIQPTTRFGQPSLQRVLESSYSPVPVNFESQEDCSFTVTPRCLRKLYGVYDTIAHPDPKNKLGVSGFLDQYARYEDFHSFMRTFSPHNNETHFTVTSINGGLNEQNSSRPSSEASVDIQYALSLAYNTTATYFTTGGRGPSASGTDQLNRGSSTNEPYLEQLHYLLGLPDDDLPAVLSTSYGEYEQTVPRSYANETCNMFAQLGARGVSVVFASGDSGAGGSCVSNNGSNRTRFLPAFPASCPFVTAVGGTHGTNPEKAVHFSGGGFSEMFPRPKYQDEVVHKYFDKLDNKWDGLYNQQGRGVPDVAAQAVDFTFVDHGRYQKFSGTGFVIQSYYSW